MRRHRIIGQNRIQWDEEPDNRLRYETLFRDSSDDRVTKETVDPAELIRQKEQVWKERLENARKQAYDQGFREGLEQGRKEAGEEMDHRVRRLAEAFEIAHAEWKENREQLTPALLDLTFDMAEAILGIPCRNSALEDCLREDLANLLRNLDDESRPVLSVHEEDMKIARKLVERYAGHLSVAVEQDASCKPGEFRMETRRETVVRDYKVHLRDFRESLTLPSWEESS